jgi:hypothetical protein
MKRRTSELPIRVFSYGLRPPTHNADLVASQIRSARIYRNQLIELELHRRQAYRAVLGTHQDLAQIGAEILELQARVEELRLHIKSARKDARKRVAQPNAVEQVKLLRDRLKILRAEAARIRVALREDPRIQAEVSKVDEDAKAAIKKARAECGVYWGTYLLVEAAVDAARKGKNDPRFGRWNGEGAIGVQLQGGLPVADVMSGSNELFRIDPLPTEQWDTRSGRRSAYSLVHIRVGSDEKRKAIWAVFPLLMHRPLPTDGIIKQAQITRVRLARKDRFELKITVEAESLAKKITAPKSAPIAAINFGWRIRPGGLRVAMVVDEIGNHREIILPERITGRLDKAESLQSIRDQRLEEFRQPFVDVMRAMPDLPEWITEDLKTMHAWRSHERFHRFVCRWKDFRREHASEVLGAPVEHDDILGHADYWRRVDLHLLQWQDYSRVGALRARREVYRLLAADLSHHYSKILLEDFDLRKIARKPLPEEQDESFQAMRKNRQRASVSSLRLAIEQRCFVEYVPAIDNTHICHVCSSNEEFDAIVHVEHTCSQCGSTWDQDVNNGRNQLRRFREYGPQSEVMLNAE